MGLQRVGHYLETNLYTCCALVSHSVMSNSLRPHCLPGFSVHGILQARLLEWVASSFSRGSSWPRNRTWVSHIAGRFFTIRATWKHTHTHTSEKAMASQSSTLAWKIPWTEEPGRLQSMGLRRVVHDWATSLSLFTFMHWRRKWQATPVFLPGESQGWGCTESDTTGVT